MKRPMRPSAALAGLAVLGFLGFSSPLSAQNQAEHFTVDVSRSTQDLKVGDKGTLSIVINPAAGKKVHDQAPLIVNVKAPKGLQFAKTKLGHADVANKGEKSPELKAEFTASEAGAQPTSAELQFFICTDKWCERMTTRVQVNVTVR